MKVEVQLGDITSISVDAIVNAANPGLLGGGGVDGAIHRAGGPKILEECQRIREHRYPEGLPRGLAVTTTAGDLPATWVIHTAGPIFSRGEDRSAILASCYRESLKEAGRVGARTIAFPAISAGVYGWPVEDATDIAVQAVLHSPPDVQEKIQKVILVAFSPEVENAWKQALKNSKS
ncbi:O-acetyl-ADP-ribose deacetylase [Corynebacterium sp. 3HC-13]|uniref:O-acetyl-ADP-ribose deacetylase n=1 Tax=Corynebacterium poyangense TaxID=2684405 RepID=UPI001CCA010C|nr:O-acetyl-ADP-ribose deacetylase [Corynebacterium poyangense]MBZ8176994.1 O-acetyl-ADP-ribose deacetylase [Corynebacterium poyangense]